MGANPNVAVAVRYYDALNRKDLHGLPLAPDVVMESPVTPRLQGAAAVIEYLEALISIAKAIRTVDFIADGSRVAVEFEVTTETGVIPGFECLEISDGSIRRLRPYFDARLLTNDEGSATS